MEHTVLPSHSATEDAEGELLPFALDGDGMPASPQPIAPLRVRAGSGVCPSGELPALYGALSPAVLQELR